MSPTAVVSKRKCGAKKRQGAGTCKLPAGHGTDHVGRGRCRRHGGNTHDHRNRANREEAIEFAVGALGAEIGANPLDALLAAVRLACGAVAYWRVRLSGYKPGDTTIPRDVAEGYAEALDRQARVAKAALDGKLDEKLVRIVQREADIVTLAAEEGLAAIKADPKTRQAFAQAFAQALLKFEDEPPVIEGRVLAP